MRATICVILCVVAATFGFAQQGHPLTGTWAGDWGASPTQRTHLSVVLNWDGQKVSGTLNPGPDAINLPNVSVDVGAWTIKFEAEGKDKSGAVVHIAADGKLENLGSPHRTIKGSWKQGTASGDFKLTRD
jgi:hypothetical protein